MHPFACTNGHMIQKMSVLTVNLSATSGQSEGKAGESMGPFLWSPTTSQLHLTPLHNLTCVFKPLRLWAEVEQLLLRAQRQLSTVRLQPRPPDYTMWMQHTWGCKATLRSAEGSEDLELGHRLQHERSSATRRARAERQKIDAGLLA